MFFGFVPFSILCAYATHAHAIRACELSRQSIRQNKQSAL